MVLAVKTVLVGHQVPLHLLVVKLHLPHHLLRVNALVEMDDEVLRLGVVPLGRIFAERDFPRLEQLLVGDLLPRFLHQLHLRGAAGGRGGRGLARVQPLLKLLEGLRRRHSRGQPAHQRQGQ